MARNEDTICRNEITGFHVQDVPDENVIDGDGEGFARANDFDLASFLLSVELDKGL